MQWYILSWYMHFYNGKYNKISNVHDGIVMMNHWQKIKSICTKDIHVFPQKKIKNAFHAFFRHVSVSVVGYKYEHMNLNLRNWKIERNVGEPNVMETCIKSYQR